MTSEEAFLEFYFREGDVEDAFFRSKPRWRLVVKVCSPSEQRPTIIGLSCGRGDAAKILGVAEDDVEKCIVYRGKGQARGGWCA